MDPVTAIAQAGGKFFDFAGKGIDIAFGGERHRQSAALDVPDMKFYFQRADTRTRYAPLWILGGLGVLLAILFLAIAKK